MGVLSPCIILFSRPNSDNMILNATAWKGGDTSIYWMFSHQVRSWPVVWIEPQIHRLAAQRATGAKHLCT